MARVATGGRCVACCAVPYSRTAALSIDHAPQRRATVATLSADKTVRGE